MDPDGMSDDHCIFCLFASVMRISQLLLPALWAGKVIASVKCVVPIATLGGIILGDLIPGLLF